MSADRPPGLTLSPIAVIRLTRLGAGYLTFNLTAKADVSATNRATSHALNPCTSMREIGPATSERFLLPRLALDFQPNGGSPCA